MGKTKIIKKGECSWRFHECMWMENTMENPREWYFEIHIDSGTVAKGGYTGREKRYLRASMKRKAKSLGLKLKSKSGCGRYNLEGPVKDIAKGKK